ncbi:hypothetical protein [Paraburkholderia atlantica]|uniref:hypothetical protein n=1 Tax=Paraburkholderia atlantica TaxID=2654982 RepID=UPI0005A17C1B|nr:hypothetical protein [Paraburkholderia atlantica]
MIPPLLADGFSDGTISTDAAAGLLIWIIGRAALARKRRLGALALDQSQQAEQTATLTLVVFR